MPARVKRGNSGQWSVVGGQGSGVRENRGAPCHQRKNTSSALLGTENGGADAGSGLNLLNTDGFFRKCSSKASIRCCALGWSDKSSGASPIFAPLKSCISQTRPQGL